MKTVLPWILWLWLALALVGACVVAPPLRGAALGGESSRLLFFHVPMAWTAFVAFVSAGIWSVMYLRARRPCHDRAANAAVRLGLVFCVLATLTGTVWAYLRWPSLWDWDARQVSIIVALAYYAVYLVLRRSVEDREVRARVSAAHAVLGLMVAPFLFFGAPRMAAASLHPQPLISARTLTGRAVPAIEPAEIAVLAGVALGFIALFFWLHGLATRLAALEDGEPTA